jgi:assimilatory nitrate reductase catalytic subunit
VTLFVRRHGPRTEELVRTPGRFGLGQVPKRLAPESTTTLVCGFCSTGCSLTAHIRDGEAVNLTPTRGYAVNLGMACPKGWEALTPLAAPDRATMPLLRDDSGRLVPVSWDTAVDRFVGGFKAIQSVHGRASVAWLGTGQLPSEELAILGTFAKLGMGVIHGDGNTRQCMATSVVAYKESFGFDAPPYTYADFEQSDVIVLVGSNLAVAHPIMWERVRRNRRSPEVLVVDPRRTETAMAATQHLALAPKSDLELLYGIAHVLVREGWIDRAFVDAHTTGFEAYAAHLAAFTPERVTAATGLAVEAIEGAARTIHEGERVSFWWTMGVNQSHQAVRTAQAIIDLALLTGNIGRPGTGANSVTGQCNAMGSRLFSNTTNLLGGHDFRNADHRSKVAGVLGVDAALIPDQPSKAYDQILDGVHRGGIKGLWIVATNSAHSWIDRSVLRELRPNLELLVVQDMYATTETAQLADLVLPAAGWGEKDGTFINSERRIARIRAVRRPPGQAKSDFEIVHLLAEAWGCGEMLERWTSPEAAFRILRDVTAGQPCDITGVGGYEHLDEAGGIQWPYPAGTTTADQERRLFEDGRFFTDDGRARFVFDEPTGVPEPTDDRYPFTLLTGRGSSAEWHTRTRTGKSPMLRSLSPQEPYVELSPPDAAALGVAADDWVVVESRRGHARCRAVVTATVQEGHVFLPMHDASTNRLTRADFDPHSRQPSYKHCAVAVRPLEARDA